MNKKKRIYASLLLSSLLLTTVTAPIVATADSIDDQINSKNQEISDLVTKQDEAQKQITSLENQVSDLNKEGKKIEKQQTDLLNESDKLQKEISDLQVRIEKRTATIKEQARDVQVNGSDMNILDAVLKSDSLSDAVSRIQAVNTFIKANNALVEQQKQDQTAVKDKKAKNETKLKQIEQNQIDLENKKADLEAKQADLNVLKASFALQQSTKEDEKQQLEAQKAAAEAEQRRIAQEQAAQAEAIRKAAEEQANVVNRPTTPSSNSNSNNSTNSSSNTNNTNSNSSTDNNTNSNSNTNNNSNNNSNNDSNPTPAPAPTPDPTPTPGRVDAAAIIAEAKKYLGSPYVWGAKGPSAFDCSGFTSFIYSRVAGKNIGGWTGAQEGAGTRISVSQAQPGDLLFWSQGGTSYHVAIYMGGGQFIHASNPRDGVKITSISDFTPQFAVHVN